MQKAEIRKIYKAKRLALAPEQYESYNKAISQLFWETVDLTSVRCIHCYLPVVSRKEVNTFLIIDRILEEFAQIRLLVPKILEGEMVAKTYTNGIALEVNSFGVLEPKGHQVSLDIPDLVIAPLLAFDPHGYRVGYGGGYYDKYFASLPANVLKVGLSFFPSTAQIEDLDEFDIPLDFCITPEKVYEFKYGYF